MPNSTISLIKANESDLKIIEELAYDIWHDYYPGIISSEQIDYMLKKFYNQKSLKKQIKEDGDEFYLVLVNNEPKGFISINHKGHGEYFLGKFYILQNIAAKGKGTRAFKQLLSIIEPSVIRLTVNRENFKSINFYFKNGFVIEKTADFDIGNGYFMNDFIMKWNKPI